MASKSSKHQPADLANLSFEDALKRLNETVAKLETGKLTLSEATVLYEEGIKLAHVCTEKIAAAEMRITQIRTAYGEQMRMYEDDAAGDDLDDDDEDEA
ncbi:MAG: exodeoxyribonuclease VII small subunit [SAR202 cluster bacterium]|nr:exodeoxyribonuclease VII small subunit [SAR202 cluster bacterium]